MTSAMTGPDNLRLGGGRLRGGDPDAFRYTENTAVWGRCTHAS